jgi:starch-binding outer membrane protein, SusD/RagB family
MKSFKSFGKFFLTATVMVGMATSCADLKEEVYSEITADEQARILGSLSDTEFDKTVLASYNKFGGLAGHNGLFSINEVSTDELIIPVRGGDWGDGGQWTRMHRHEYTPTEESINNTWSMLYSAIATANRLIVQLPAAKPDKGPALAAELRAFRALCYFYLCDMYGNVPVFSKFPVDLTEAVPKPRAEVYNFVEQELNAVYGSLKKTKTYGRMNFYAAKALAAKLYLNAGVYKGAPEWDKAIAACDEVLGGPYAMEADYYSNFKSANEGSKENIFVLPYDPITLTGFNLPQMTLHYASQATYKLQDQPWNGYCTTADFYNSYDAADKRKKNFIAGPQFAFDGTSVLVDSSPDGDPDGPNLNYTPQLNAHYPNCFRQAGARVGKYEFAIGSPNTLANDFPIFRLADVKLMKAESLFRKNAGDAAALALVNEMRTRANVPAFASLTNDNFLAELGREKFVEAWRRNDMIRFGKYFTAYSGYKTSVDAACKGVFPIPKGQLEANPSLVQSECYR